MRDEDVPAWWGALGLPGLVDMHVHFLPERLMAAVWRFFDEARERYGVSWPVTYRTSDAE
jgi:cytosine/adenosine deaminase-related metal-dependent hydrolase